MSATVAATDTASNTSTNTSSNAATDAVIDDDASTGIFADVGGVKSPAGIITASSTSVH